MRIPSLLRFVALAVSAALFFVTLTPGCGRSSLELETTDASVVDGGSCGPSTCSTGCCDSNGICRVGNDMRACGTAGQRCADCPANGFQFCDGRHVCGRTVTNCGPAECPGGCCSADGGTTTCLAGTDATACGRSGATCTDCAVQGRSCDPTARLCGAAKCDPSNCSGCCVGDQCLTGIAGQACGTKGLACTNCAANGQVCTPTGGGGGLCQGTPTCGPQNCGGCCDGTTCVTGSDSTACGKQGSACANCTAAGKECVALGKPNELTCQTPAVCGPANCPGCCAGNACVVATTPAACGKGGAACAGCGANETCNAGVCTPQANCGPGNCAGCCIGAGICAVGNQNTACGVAGGQCLNCQGLGSVCQAGACQAAACGPANCAGCCAGNVCVLGTQDNSCGQNGAQCNDCTPGNQVCQGRVCHDKCGPANCGGCCTAANACALGFTNGACGSAGAACANCTAAGSTCDTLTLPRVCANQQNTCPKAYPGCAAGTTTPVTPAAQNVCDAVNDLDAVRAACTGPGVGPASGTCVAAFAALAAANPACSACLTPFNQPFVQLQGIYLCAAPFVSASCNHSTACATECADTSCGLCPAASEAQCLNQVNGNGGACRPFVNQTVCAGAALAAPPGRLCNPGTYNGDYGRWIRAVGAHYCGNGP